MDAQAAVSLLELAESTRSGISGPDKRMLTVHPEAMGREAFERARAAGRSMPEADAVALALRTDPAR